MTKDAVGGALRRARVYVDFGHLPGKDRMPREAVAAGAVVFVRRRGAGVNAEDFPVPDFFRFDDDDVASGELHRRVAAVLADPAPHWAQQEFFRERVRGERAELEEQLRVIRGLRPAAWPGQHSARSPPGRAGDRAVMRGGERREPGSEGLVEEGGDRAGWRRRTSARRRRAGAGTG